MLYFVQLLVTIEFLGFYVVKSTPEGLAAFLVEYPSICLVDFV